MPRPTGFLGVEFADRFRKSYARLTAAQQSQTDKVVMALAKQAPTPGMRVKPIEPEKFYLEARINDGDRLIHRLESGRLWVVDVVSHDDIARYAKALTGLL
ncbi:MAG: hypothetical protein U0974_00330 [Gemmatimonadales bacterium]|nr:hypothetical protein [Gemmatimonadales bacterium]MDZ4388166.1 hypothetical protein [Gemmatimonadales bacterium]